MRCKDKKSLPHWLAACLLVVSSAHGAPIDCRKTKSVDEQTICRHRDLVETDSVIAKTYARLSSNLHGEAKSLLIARQRFWLRERSNCQNAGARAINFEDGLYACLKWTMSSRQAVLNRLAANPSSLTIDAASYGFIDPWYLTRFGTQYLRKETNVFGRIEMTSCAYDETRSPRGSIVWKDRAVEIRFPRMPASKLKFLCDQAPTAHWHGMVLMDNGHPYLSATDVLGNPI